MVCEVCASENSRLFSNELNKLYVTTIFIYTSSEVVFKGLRNISPVFVHATINLYYDIYYAK